MKTVVLISCTKSKRSYACAAKELYDKSQLFRESYKYAKKFDCPIFILSAKYGLVSENQIIEPYEESLAQKTDVDKEHWARKVAEEALKSFAPDQTRFIILAGRDYYEKLLPYFQNYELPLRGMQIGERIAALSDWNKQRNIAGFTDLNQAKKTDICDELHHIFNKLPRYSYNTIDQIPFDNGIYVMFENGEQYRGFDRIVRVGTHTSNGRLKQRLRDHFLKENKDGSIFRKNIGKAILNKNEHPYLTVWSSDSRDKNAMRKKYGNQFDEDFQARIENQVSRYIKASFTFTCFPVSESDKRLRYEEGLIATLYQTEDFHPSSNWRGNYSPIRAIRESGLWLVQGLDGISLSQTEFETILTLVNQPIQSPVSEVANTQPGVQEVMAYLEGKLMEASEEGRKSLTIRSGQVHSEMNLKNRMPTVCSAMYKLMKNGDVIEEQPPKGKGSRLVVTYKIQRG